MRERYRLHARVATITAAAIASLAISNCATPDDSPKNEAEKTFASVGESASANGGDAAPRRQKLTEAPIGAVGHGALITPDGKVMSQPTPEFIRDAQAYYIDRLLREASPATRKEFEGRERSTEDEGQSELAAQAAAFTWLIDNVHPADAPVLASFNRFLAEKGGVEDATGYDRAPYFIDTVNSGAAYVKECKENGVPTPPKWGAEEWKHRGTQNTVLISTEYRAEVYVYDEDPLGVCYALPRYNEEGKIPLFGVICQGNASKRACFWDNKTKPIDPALLEDLTDGADFFGGAQLSEGKDVCTTCHRGENAFIIHENTPLDLRSPSTVDGRPREGLQTQYADGWVQPLVHSSWPQNPQPRALLGGIKLDLVGNATTPPDGSCLSCHNEFSAGRLGDLSLAYCSNVLLPAIDRKLMPPPVQLKEGEVAPSYEKHIRAIREACDAERPRPSPSTESEENSNEQPNGETVESDDNLAP